MVDRSKISTKVKPKLIDLTLGPLNKKRTFFRDFKRGFKNAFRLRRKK
jgi:hypothetical protein